MKLEITDTELKAALLFWLEQKHATLIEGKKIQEMKIDSGYSPTVTLTLTPAEPPI